ncbi:prepilin peptidase [Evansella sp. LMS18]|uniref:A24 family peptidase n=1 Tax=Evansella sp. LMS18 TaxID=2924033 RepID=UPI0020CFEE89|nr:prepilin peptidase [Evansella sp. LMS18]UTR11519.1 prepilin peptidase [Evansella sp. LMS18]
MIINAVLGVALVVSLITDIRSRKILNIVTFPAILFGLIYYSIADGFSGFLFSGAGFLVGFALLLLPYLLGGMGAGDVKLMAAIGALTGISFVLYSFVYTALIGGAISIFLIMKKRGVFNSIKSFFFSVIYLRSSLGSLIFPKEKQNSIAFPYGVAIVFGTVCAFIWGGF